MHHVSRLNTSKNDKSITQLQHFRFHRPAQYAAKDMCPSKKILDQPQQTDYQNYIKTLMKKQKTSQNKSREYKFSLVIE